MIENQNNETDLTKKNEADEKRCYNFKILN